MIIELDTSSFSSSPNTLLYMLYQLKKAGSWVPVISEDIENVICTTPIRILKYTKSVTGILGVSSVRERIVVKNIAIALRYLKLVGRRTFLDDRLTSRFMKRVFKKAEWSYRWARDYGPLTEEQEMCFVKDLHYANLYITGIKRVPFCEKIHGMILLRSYDNLRGAEKNGLNSYVQFCERVRSVSSKD